MYKIGIRREDKNKWERRAPLVPEHVKTLREQFDLAVCVQESPIRAFRPEEYEVAGARIVPDLRDCPVIFAVKEIPASLLEPGKTYVYFSHTIKGQPYNMPMLRRLLDLNCQLIDYERITDERGRRLIFFGDYAGRAGMLDTLWALGQKLAAEGIETPLREVRPAVQYADLASARAAVRAVGEKIATEGLPETLTPLIVGFAGYGNVSRGAQELLDLLPVTEIAPQALETFTEHDPHTLYKVVFKEEDMVVPRAEGATFVLQDYYDHPEKYRSQFTRYLPHLTVLVNGIYWTSRYPRLVTRKWARSAWGQDQPPRLRVIGDISCDIGGGVELTVKATMPDEPCYVVDPAKMEAIPGVEGKGPVIMAVDNLPCELPRESSEHFSSILRDMVPDLARADWSLPFAELALPSHLRRAVIAHRGELTPDYAYLAEYLLPEERA